MTDDTISFYDFLVQTEYIFSGFISVVGKVTEGSEKIYLEDNPAFRNYKRKYINAEKNDTKRPHLVPRTKNFFLNKCRYYIYPEKRESEYTLKNGEHVESLEVFSSKCVTLFFQLTGINFSFLRINPNYNKKEFVSRQKECLVDLFDSILSLFMKSAIKKGKIVETKHGLQKVEDNDFIIKNLVFVDELIKHMKHLYIRYRYILGDIDSEYLSSFTPILNNEIVKLSEYKNYVNTKLCDLIFLPGINYNLCRNETDIGSKFTILQSIESLNYIGNGLKTIYDADNIDDVLSKLAELFNLKNWYIGDKTIEVKKFINKPPKDWKNICIQYLISYCLYNDIRLPSHNVFDEDNFVSCIVYHSYNTYDENCKNIHECENNKKCEFRKNCRSLTIAKNSVSRLRKTIWDKLIHKSPYEEPTELYELIEIIERICFLTLTDL